MLRPWDAAFERECNGAVQGVLDPGASETARQESWRSLLVLIAPRIEGWAERSRVLAHWRLCGPDEARAVMVATLGRLHADGCENLRRYRDRRAHTEEGADPQLDAVARLAGLADGDEAVSPTAVEPADDAEHTPFRAWLLTLMRFVVNDHVRTRLGWASEAGVTKRDLGTGADRLSSVPEPAVRPAITDWLTARQMLSDIDRATAAFPEPMRAALNLWVEDRSYGEIAAQLRLSGASEAEKLVRAAKARLREKFR